MFAVTVTESFETSRDADAVYKQVEELTMLLAYLTSWEERQEPHMVHRAWKGYDFGVLRSLDRAGYIRGGGKAKSLTLTSEGIARAEALLARYSS